MSSPQLVAHVPIPTERLKRELAAGAVAGFHGRIVIEIRISPEVVVDRTQTLKPSMPPPQQGKAFTEARDLLVDQAMSSISEKIREMTADFVSITGHFNDGKMLQVDVKEVFRPA